MSEATTKRTPSSAALIVLTKADPSKHVAAGALHELQVVGMVDDAAGISVLPVDADGKSDVVHDECWLCIGVPSGTGKKLV